MGKGDIKTKRGKLTKGTFGNSRPHKNKKTETTQNSKKETANQ
ncbi:MAG: 30S ribosomal protein THX [Hymenobacteraceae bacterium]|nr:30S ribosomal protein THX [Hymenobacteraceae bacterium]MDX5396362.1 30S ribosomal protein THX [Hymenobacteraceae bacterium]MDX5443939.1 30S ribosomal protein THX [Hymenobacteraceae bacterium]MDX5512424.1 30S ribosomal protein THX [Hymenobacteraceae bacterium]